MDPIKVGAAIKTLRLQAQYTQHDLADRLHVTDKAVSKWERGLSVPDVSIVTKLSVLLNCDVDNLLEGNITYLEKAWQGLLLFEETGGLMLGSEAYGKPLVYFFLSYFMLAGIGDIYIACPERDRSYIAERIGDGSLYGIKLTFLPPGVKVPPAPGNTMVVYNNPFVYGANLTKYFQRAMSRSGGISVLTVAKPIGEGPTVSDVHCKNIRNAEAGGDKQFCAPIVFLPKQFFSQIEKVEEPAALDPLYAEPMGNGMIGYSITNEESLWETAFFLRYLKKQMGKDVYELEAVARNRNFLNESVN